MKIRTKTHKSNSGVKEVPVFDKVKLNIYNKVLDGKWDAKYLINHMGFTRPTAFRYVKSIKQGLSFDKISQGKGRPQTLDKISRQVILDAIDTAHEQKIHLGVGDSSEKNTLAAKISETLAEQNKRNGTTKETFVTNDRARKIANNLHCKAYNVTKITNDHMKALHDARNGINMAVASIHLNKILKGSRTKRELLLNLDATAFDSFGIHRMNKTNRGYVRKNRMQQSKQHHDEINTQNAPNSDTAVFAKHHTLVNALGMSAPYVFGIADDRLPKDETRTYGIQELAPEQGMTGYVCIHNTRCGNANFYTWYYETILIPFVTSLRKKYMLDLTHKAVLWLDGEDIQLAPLCAEPLRKLLRHNNIDVFKGPASTTPKTQFLDTSDVFRMSHHKSKQKPAEIFADTSTALRNQLVDAFKEHDVSFSKNKSKFYNRLQKQVTCILRATYSLLQCINESTVFTGLIRTGIVAFNESYNLGTIFDNFNMKRTVDQEIQLIDDCHKLVDNFGKYGMLTDAAIEKCEYMKFLFLTGKDAPNTKPRDQQVLHSMRTVVITSDAAMHTVAAQKQRKVDAKEASEEKRKTNLERAKEVAFEKGRKTAAKELKKSAKLMSKAKPVKRTRKQVQIEADAAPYMDKEAELRRMGIQKHPRRRDQVVEPISS